VVGVGGVVRQDAAEDEGALLGGEGDDAGGEVADALAEVVRGQAGGPGEILAVDFVEGCDG
jgi:hypothetical protein